MHPSTKTRLCQTKSVILVIATVLIGLCGSSRLQSADWPMWRNDATRSGNSSENLPKSLHVEYVLRGTPRKPTWDDPLNEDVMSFDRVFEPIIMGNRLLVGFNDTDKVAAFDLSTGKPIWSYFADGPVRLPLAGSEGSVFFSSDDGFLYSLDAATGALRWRFQGAPLDHRAIGNKRLISAWPARGGPVIYGNHVYFASSIWPFMGTFIYAIDCKSGQVVWLNDETGAQYIKQPHSAPSFAGVGPQGALVATQEMLIVPGGRSVPAVFDRNTGKQRYFELNAGSKGTGGSWVTANDNHFYVHTRVKGTRQFTLSDGVKTAFMPNEPVLDGDILYSAEFEDGVAKICAWKPDGTKIWDTPGDGRGDLVLAGGVLYAAGPSPDSGKDGSAKKSLLTAIRLPSAEAASKELWAIPLDGQIERLIAGNGKLVAVSLEGNVYVLGDKSDQHGRVPAEIAIQTKPSQIPMTNQSALTTANELLEQGDAAGYALWFGAKDPGVLNAIVESEKFGQVVAVEQDAQQVESIRRQWDAMGFYGTRAALIASKPSDYRAPPYIANMIFVNPELTGTLIEDDKLIRHIYNSVRPYGGVLQLLCSTENLDKLVEHVAALKLEQAVVKRSKHSVVVERVGALPGSSDWTHQYGNVANTIKSDDRLVKLPLGVLWFGGNSNVDTLPRHGHGPPEQVVGGRLILQGMNSLTARDVYTGRVLWHRTFDNLGTFDVYFDSTYTDTPLDPAYNQVHIPGANGRGTNYVVTNEYVYIVEGNVCKMLSSATGELVREIALPQTDAKNPQEWGYIGIYNDVLIGGVGFAKYRTRLELQAAEDDEKLSKSKAGFGTKSLDRAASMAIVGFNRHTGEQLWKVDAKHSFWHNGIVAGNGKIYALDRNPKTVEDLLKRRGKELPKTYRILAFDAQDGTVKWEVHDGVFGSWLGYSAAHDKLLQAGAAASDRLATEIGQGMTVHNAADGSVVWSKSSLAYSGPCILHNDLIITNANSYTESAGAFYIKDGSQKMVKNPVTGRMQPWKLTRAYGCNTISASENLLTFRSGAAGYYDLLTESGTGNLGGFRSSCTSNLVAANGILNAPDMTRTCSCSYQNQSSIALVHMPELETWTIDNAAMIQEKSDRVENLGINLGAPGDRRDGNGVTWLEFPVVAGDSPNYRIELEGSYSTYQDHPATMPGASKPWVTASGVQGLSRLTVGLKPANPYKLSTGMPIVETEDDAEEGADGATSTSSSDLEMVTDESDQIVGLRFDQINVSSASVIRSAYLQFTADAANEDETELVIHAEFSGSAPPFAATQKNISSRTITKSSVPWKPLPWNKVGERGDPQRTPNLATLIQEVIQHPDWKPGNALVLAIRGKGKRVATAFAGKQGAAQLFMDADEVDIVPDSKIAKTPYRINLFFGMPKSIADSPRRFTVSIPETQQSLDIDIDPATEREQMRTMERVLLGDTLELNFKSRSGLPILSGVEIIQLDQ
jgi:outer membrane protein assembly factor BamB/precorrin-6B methylase 2